MFVVFSIIVVCVSSCVYSWRVNESVWERVNTRDAYNRASTYAAQLLVRLIIVPISVQCYIDSDIISFICCSFILQTLLFTDCRCIVQRRSMSGYLIFEKLRGRSSRITRPKQRCLSNVRQNGLCAWGISFLQSLKWCLPSLRTWELKYTICVSKS